MLMAYIGNNLGFVAHYALLGQWTAVAHERFHGRAIGCGDVPRSEAVAALASLGADADIGAWQLHDLASIAVVAGDGRHYAVHDPPLAG